MRFARSRLSAKRFRGSRPAQEGRAGRRAVPDVVRVADLGDLRLRHLRRHLTPAPLTLVPRNRPLAIRSTLKPTTRRRSRATKGHPTSSPKNPSQAKLPSHHRPETTSFTSLQTPAVSKPGLYPRPQTISWSLWLNNATEPPTPADLAQSGEGPPRPFALFP